MADNMTNEASSSAHWSSSSHWWIYDVYLSFRGLDTRRNFIHYLYKELSGNGIYTFLDEEELKGGENINSQILEAIEGSRIAIIVFSENYASSTWCLDELTSILHCKKIGRIQEVLPVFYKVDPSDVRHQRNTYAKALKRHEERYEMERVERWKAALKEAANLSGWDQVNIANGYETELTKIIVQEVLKKVENILLFDVTCTIGLDFHTKHIGSLLKDGLDVRIVGIYGPGGIGKTAIAKAVFKDMFTKFEGSSFLHNVGELSRNHKCLAFLQRMLLTDIFRGINIDIDYEDKGIIIIKERLCHKKVLIVLDDVDEMRQFYKLVGGHGCLGPGSRIILTTRDEHLLNKLDVDERYIVKTMNQSESLQLFSFHAFQQKHPPQGYEQLSNDVIHYAGGLPLALEILGSSLWKKHQNVWKEVLKKLRESPNYEIFEKLKISYDVLDDFNQAIFLDISCFFIGKDKKFVIRFLDACGLGGEIGIKILTERSLITINEDNRLCMHNIIRGMGREIVHKESFQHPGKRSRLWNHHDVLNVLQHRTGTDAVEGLQLKGNEFSPLSVEGFFCMPNLRLLKVNSSRFDITIDWEHSFQKWGFCFENLVWFSWKVFPYEYIPNNFHLGNLVILDMQESKLKEFWKGTKYLTKLEDLNLSYSRHLTCNPDFLGLLNLVNLNLSQCSKLQNLSTSISFCTKLETLNMWNCQRLESLPLLPSSLRFLDVSCCKKLKSLPNLSNLKHLLMLDLSYCEMLTEVEGLEGLKSAETIKLFNCINLKSFVKKRIIQDICKDFGNLNVCDIIFGGNEVPEWFGFQSESHSLSCEVTKPLNMEMKGLVICIVCSDATGGWLFQNFNFVKVVVVVYNESKDFTWRHESVISLDHEEMTTWVIKIPNCVWKAEDGDTIKVSVKRTIRHDYIPGKVIKLRVKKIGVHFCCVSQDKEVSEENSEASPSI